MELITGKILKLNNWEDGKSIGLAKEAGNKMIASGMERDAALATLDAVRANPGNLLADTLLADLAREILRKTLRQRQAQALRRGCDSERRRAS